MVGLLVQVCKKGGALLACRSLVVLALVHVGACATAAGEKRIEWTEDARLSDGRVIVVTRAEEYRHIVDVGAGFREGWLLEQSDISAELPRPIQRRVTWRGSLQPVVLDLQPDGTVYLVGVPASGKARHDWKLPRNELYAVLRLNGDWWERVPLEQLPAAIQPNLFASSYRLFITEGKLSGRHVDLKLKGELDSNPQIDRRYKTVVRLPIRAKEAP